MNSIFTVVLVSVCATLATLLVQILTLPPGSSSTKPLEFTNRYEFENNYKCESRYSIRIISRDPLVMLVDNFLLPGEADYLRNITAPRMQRSGVAESADNYNAVSNVRTSSSAFLRPAETLVVKCIEHRAAELTQTPLADCEPLQVVWYTVGQKYEPHFDYFPRKDLTDEWSVKSGQRWVTILVYLNEEFEGGGTSFPKLGIRVRPTKNKAVLWYNVNLTQFEDSRTLHGGDPVDSGEKWAINIWQRKKIPGWDSKENPEGTLEYTVKPPLQSIVLS